MAKRTIYDHAYRELMLPSLTAAALNRWRLATQKRTFVSQIELLASISRP
jgi:hypothetical protein